MFAAKYQLKRVTVAILKRVIHRSKVTTLVRVLAVFRHWHGPTIVLPLVYCPADHTLITACTVVQAVVYANGQSNGKGRFSTTHSGKTTGPILIKLEI